ncbi:MAG: DUF4435 domain-containing protein [Cyanobacteria bacterium J06649_11]
MSYLEELRSSRDKAQVAYQEFALSTRRWPNSLFCFFEGKDNSYYVPRIKEHTNNYYPIRCGGREKVLEVYALINNHSEYFRYRKAFFIDRDFNEPLEEREPPIFETPTYSIENLYVSEVVFREILINELHLSENADPEFQLCITLFRKRQQEFHDCVTLFNSWYSCLIELRNLNGTNTHVNLKDKLPKGFVNISLQEVVQNYDLEKIKEVFPNAPTVEESVLTKKIEHYENTTRRLLFRGKYELGFVLTLIELILKDSNEKQEIIKRKLKFAFGQKLSIAQGINVFSGYAETPEELSEYLKKVVG